MHLPEKLLLTSHLRALFVTIQFAEPDQYPTCLYCNPIIHVILTMEGRCQLVSSDLMGQCGQSQQLGSPLNNIGSLLQYIS